MQAVRRGQTVSRPSHKPRSRVELVPMGMDHLQPMPYLQNHCLSRAIAVLGNLHSLEQPLKGRQVPNIPHARALLQSEGRREGTCVETHLQSCLAPILQELLHRVPTTLLLLPKQVLPSPQLRLTLALPCVSQDVMRLRWLPGGPCQKMQQPLQKMVEKGGRQGGRQRD
jgi:hypothetical protein